MGKNRIIRILGNIIGNVVVHKILLKYTNKPESIPHLKNEIIDYRDNSLEKASEYNWSEKDKNIIKEEALKNFYKKMETKYPDVKFPKEEIPGLIEETLEECM